MTAYGAVRHGPDIRADDSVKESDGLLTQQTLTNIYDSQKGKHFCRFQNSVFLDQMLKNKTIYNVRESFCKIINAFESCNIPRVRHN